MQAPTQPPARRAEMQPHAAKRALGHRTPFSVEDILDPRKFTGRIICAEETTGENTARSCRDELQLAYFFL